MKNKQNSSSSITTIVPCPNCKKSVRWDPVSPYRPFCSKRCKLIDLGDWASENHRIPGKKEFGEEIE